MEHLYMFFILLGVLLALFVGAYFLGYWIVRKLFPQITLPRSVLKVGEVLYWCFAVCVFGGIFLQWVAS